MPKSVAIQGYKGCFHEQAARLFFCHPDRPCHSERSEESVSIVECATFQDLFKVKADAIVMAIENTVSGGLLHNFELLRASRLPVKGEVYIRIGQNLMALPGQKLEDIREVRTHYMAINQTRPWFEKNAPWIRLTESEDTAKSAAELAQSGERGVGAVAGELAASLYGLEILAPGIETFKQNFTRFLIVDSALEVPEEKILTILSFYDMNLTRIQSLPIPGREWQYFFYADIKFESYQRYLQALQAVKPLLEDLQILGEYEAAI